MSLTEWLKKRVHELLTLRRPLNDTSLETKESSFSTMVLHLGPERA